MANKLYLTRSEIFAAAWALFRSARGARPPRRNTRTISQRLRNAWAAAKGDAFWLVAIRDVARWSARKPAYGYRSPLSGRPSRSRSELMMIRNFAA